MSEQTLKYEDYLKRADAGGLNAEIDDADSQRQARQDDATLVNWEQRYKELEKLNSRQAQTLGEYRKLVDEFVTNPTPAEDKSVKESQPITVDDLYDDPDSAIRRAVESHPAIREAREIRDKFDKQQREDSFNKFVSKHSDFKEIAESAEFANWVQDDFTRMELASRADKYDLSAADALFSLYKAESGLTTIETQKRQQEEIDAASLEDGSALMVTEPAKYSRSEFVRMKRRAVQGDLEADEWIRNNVAKYREALASGNVRD